MRQFNNTPQAHTKGVTAPGKQRSYNEIVDFLDTNWETNKNDLSLAIIKQLDQALGSLTQKVNTILVTGTNGKSLTAHFSTRLLAQEGLSVGTFFAPHLLTYNERIVLQNETVSSKTFSDLGNEVLNAAEAAGLTPSSREVLLMMALLHFRNSNVDVAILEVDESSHANPITICAPKIVAITRVTDGTEKQLSDETIQSVLSVVKPGSHVVCADQSKINLHAMQIAAEQLGGVWAMPIRKLAALAYPFEQLHGRCAALAERIAQIYVNSIVSNETSAQGNSLLAKQKGQRGRPTLEAKRQSELNPKRTLEQFWKETLSTLPARFQLLDKEKPIILLDNASNLDAFKNLLLGIRLLHYQRSLKGLAIILGCTENAVDMTEFLKLLRYFFKKTSGLVVVCPVEASPAQQTGRSWDVEKVTNDIKSMKIKAVSAANFQDAFKAAQDAVDERQGLVVITGCASIIAKYWHHKGIKKV